MKNSKKRLAAALLALFAISPIFARAAEQTPSVSGLTISGVPMAGKTLTASYTYSPSETIEDYGMPVSTIQPDNLSLAHDHDGTLYVTDSNFLLGATMFRSESDGSWSQVAQIPNAHQNINTLISSGTPYVAFADAVNMGVLRIRSFDGNSWNDVGDPFVGHDYLWAELEEDSQDNLYVAYVPGYPSAPEVRRFQGGQWVSVGDLSAYSSANYLSFKLVNDIPYLILGNWDHPKMLRYVSGAWEEVAGLEAALTEGFSELELKVMNGQLYVPYTNYDGYPRLLRADADGFTQVGGSIDDSVVSTFLEIEAHDHTFYAMYSDSYTYTPYFKKLVNGNWVDVTYDFAGQTAYMTSMENINGHLFILSGLVQDPSGTPSYNNKVILVWSGEGNSDYLWYRDDSIIDGTSSVRYLLQPADIGHNINVTVRPRSESGLVGTTATTTAVAVWGPVASNASISGSARVGQTLTGTYDYSSAEQFVPVAPNFSQGKYNFHVMGDNGNVYVGYSNLSDPYISKYTPSGWIALGGGPNPIDDQDQLADFIVKGGQPYVFGVNELCVGMGNQLGVITDTGSGWENVGNCIFTDYGVSTNYPLSMVSFNDEIYISYPYLTATSSLVTVVRRYHNGDWEQVGDLMPGFDQPRLAASADSLYLFASSEDGTLGRVYQLVNGTWEQIGGDFSGVPYGNLQYIDGVLYFISVDKNASPAVMTIYQYGDGAWVQVGQEFAASADYDFAQLAKYRGRLFLQYLYVSDSAYRSELDVLEGNTWVNANIPGFDLVGTENVNLTTTGERLYYGYNINNDLWLEALSDPDEGNSAYRWYRDGSVIADATAVNYTLVAADSGKEISFKVTPHSQDENIIGASVMSSPVTVETLAVQEETPAPAPSGGGGSSFVLPGATGNGDTTLNLMQGTDGSLGSVSGNGANVLGYVGSKISFWITLPDGRRELHTMTILAYDMYSGLLTLSFASEPQTITLKAGQSRELELSGDKQNDVKAVFAGSYSNRVEITLKQLAQKEDQKPVPDNKPIPQTSSQKFMFRRDLRAGQSHSDVKELQKFLNRKGYTIAKQGAGAPGKETNYFGAATKAALIKFQKAMGIKPLSGFFGPLTRATANK